jgi:hypothetical protein
VVASRLQALLSHRAQRGRRQAAPTPPAARGQIGAAGLIPAPAASDNETMAFGDAGRGREAAPRAADDALVVLDTVHVALCGLVAEMMGAARGCPAPRSHASFLAIGGSEAEAAELAQMVNALFGLSLPADAVMRSPTPDALARTIASAWFDGDGSAADLIELIEAIADAQ